MSHQLTKPADPRLVIAAYRRAIESLDNAAFQAVVAGIAMIEAKAAVPHGAFMEWLESECPEVPGRTARRWMIIAEVCLHQVAVRQLEKLATVANLTAPALSLSETLLLDDAQLPPLARALKTKISEMVTGQSRRAIELQAAELKAPRAPAGRRPSMPDRRTPDEVRAEARALWLASWETRIAEIEAMFQDGLPSDITPEDAGRVLAKLSTLTQWVTRLVSVARLDASDIDDPISDPAQPTGNDFSDPAQPAGNDFSDAPHIDV